MSKVLFLVGQTATGKTDAALAIAARIPSLIISADSRQVYQGMEIGTGGLLPPEFSLRTRSEHAPSPAPLSYWSNNQTEVWLSSCIQPNEEWSSAHFVQAARWCIERAQTHHLLPIIVGGTGLYMDQLVNPPQSLLIPPNSNLRARLALLSLEELQQEVQKLSLERWQRTNPSDRQNPRRLVRILETEQLTTALNNQALPPLRADMLWIGLKGSENWLKERIRQRVQSRIDQGMLEETKKLLMNYSAALPSLNATGYPETIAYLDKKIDEKTWVEDWTLHEQQYAKRQTTWFAKNPNIQWHDAEKINLHQELLQRVKTWYNER